MKHFNITVNGNAYNVSVEEAAQGSAPVAAVAAPVAAPAAAPVAAAPAAPVAAAPVAQGAVKVSAPMPGNILDVKAAVGTAVKAGDVLVILEAMKMENDIVAPQDGTVAAISCAKGDVVNVGDVLVSLN
ncbi:MAG: biotin/lipoyl-containing protein [Oscillospiraceae bacterium]